LQANTQVREGAKEEGMKKNTPKRKLFSHGIIAVTPEGEILHFVGYVTPPKDEDFVMLQKELDNDYDFGLTKSKSKYKLVKAPKKIVDDYLEIVNKNSGYMQRKDKKRRKS
jgi:hypothetical protein